MFELNATAISSKIKQAKEKQLRLSLKDLLCPISAFADLIMVCTYYHCLKLMWHLHSFEAVKSVFPQACVCERRRQALLVLNSNPFHRHVQKYILKPSELIIF